MSKAIEEAYESRIWAESDGPGVGAQFTFTLPEAQETDTLLPAQAPGAQRPGRVRVLAPAGDPQALRHVRDALSEGVMR